MVLYLVKKMDSFVYFVYTEPLSKPARPGGGSVITSPTPVLVVLTVSFILRGEGQVVGITLPAAGRFDVRKPL